MPFLQYAWKGLERFGLEGAAAEVGMFGIAAHWVEMFVAFYALSGHLEAKRVRGPTVARHLVMTLLFGYTGLLGALGARRDIFVAAGEEPVPMLASLHRLLGTSYLLRRREPAAGGEDRGAGKRGAGRARVPPPKGKAANARRSQNNRTVNQPAK